MLQGFISIFKAFFLAFRYPLYFIAGLVALFFFLCLIWFVIRFAQGKRLKKGNHVKVKKEPIWYRLFVKFPRQVVDDFFDKDPEFFKYQGCIIFEGRQGRGKTISQIEYARRMQQEYPLAKCIANLKYENANDTLEDWQMLMSYKNGIRGVIVIIDELQNWFSSNDSRNFPPEMLEVITQNRKNRRIILRNLTELLSSG